MNDENIKIIVCGCGQPNHLVFQNGVWLFDVKKHGNYVYPPAIEKATGCFNCHKPFPSEVKADAEKTVDEVPIKKTKKK